MVEWCDEKCLRWMGSEVSPHRANINLCVDLRVEDFAASFAVSPLPMCGHPCDVEVAQMRLLVARCLKGKVVQDCDGGDHIIRDDDVVNALCAQNTVGVRGFSSMCGSGHGLRCNGMCVRRVDLDVDILQLINLCGSR
eukprot:6488135-Amphidinium_carterae.2